LHDHHRVPRGIKCFGVVAKDPEVGFTEESSIGRRIRVGRNRLTGEHHHHISVDVLCIENHLDSRGVLDEGVLKIGTQAEELVLTRTVTSADELHPSIRVHDAALK
jgi:hypothetical protein